jgi:hypothetical protein
VGGRAQDPSSIGGIVKLTLVIHHHGDLFNVTPEKMEGGVYRFVECGRRSEWTWHDDWGCLRYQGEDCPSAVVTRYPHFAEHSFNGRISYDSFWTDPKTGESTTPAARWCDRCWKLIPNENQAYSYGRFDLCQGCHRAVRVEADVPVSLGEVLPL